MCPHCHRARAQRPMRAKGNGNVAHFVTHGAMVPMVPARAGACGAERVGAHATPENNPCMHAFVGAPFSEARGVNPLVALALRNAMTASKNIFGSSRCLRASPTMICKDVTSWHGAEWAGCTRPQCLAHQALALAAASLACASTVCGSAMSPMPRSKCCHTTPPVPRPTTMAPPIVKPSPTCRKTTNNSGTNSNTRVPA